MISLRSPISLVTVLALAACAGKEPPPAIAYDSGDFKPAVADVTPPAPVEVVEVPTPVPLRVSSSPCRWW